MPRIYFTVTNDLNYDQRMHRICGSLAAKGFDVCLVGRQLDGSKPLQKKNFEQKRLRCLFNRGFFFYAEYNTRLFIYLLFRSMDGICAIDLDTILPCLLVSKFKKIRRIYDAHEYFTEMKEVRTRTRVKRLWTWIEKACVPRFQWGYTVSGGLAAAFSKQYNRNYEVIRNLPVLKELDQQIPKSDYLLYQGAVNEGRGFEYLVPALKKTNAHLVICGDGNFMDQLKALIGEYGIASQVELKGMLLPEELWPIAQQARLGISLSEKEGTNQFLALPNKFMDYIHAGLPQITMSYPEYRLINDQYKVAVLLDELSTDKIAGTINDLLKNDQLLEELHNNCLIARKELCWEKEEIKLLDFYRKIFPV